MENIALILWFSLRFRLSYGYFWPIGSDRIISNWVETDITVYSCWYYGTAVATDRKNGARAAALSRLAASIYPKVSVILNIAVVHSFPCVDYFSEDEQLIGSWIC